METLIEARQQAVAEPTIVEVRVPIPVVAKIQAAPAPQPQPIPLPIPFPIFFASRVMIWKQDPSVLALGRRLALLPGLILNGPQDSRLTTLHPGTTPVVRDGNGDFLIVLATSPESDCVHTFSVANMALTMWEQSRGGASIPWAWNTGGNTDRLTCRPRGFNGPNAFYSRLAKELSFGFFTPSSGPNQVFTCRSLDIVAHEAGHAILDGLKPGWLGTGNVPQTGAMHEAFGDLTSVFLALSQFDQVEAFVALSRANLHAKNFLSAVAEEFGANLVPPKPSGLRNADNDLKLSEVGNQVHSLSQVFTGAIYDILADIFLHERIKQSKKKALSQILFEVAQHLRALLLDAIIAAPASGATFANVADLMIKKSKAQGDPPIYATFIKNRFIVREVVVSATPITQVVQSLATTDYANAKFTGAEGEVTELVATDHLSATPGVPQDRTGCCGTMQSPEYARPDNVLKAELKKLAEDQEFDKELALLSSEVRDLEKEFA